MNLFDILSAGKRDLNEENVSSFLAWFLDPKQSHGCGSLFLTRLLNIVDKDKYQPWLSKILNVDVLLEEEVETNSGSKRFIDIVIIISCTDKKSIIFAIENKIREGVYDKLQLKEEYEGLIKNYGDADISLLYLTPNKSVTLLPNDFNIYSLTWADFSNETNYSTIVGMFRNILKDDSVAKINPLSNELIFFLKSFIVFAEKGFRAYNKIQASVKRGNKYFKDSVLGIDGVRELRKQNESDNNGNIYIGFIGGINALKKINIEQLVSRPFKWDDNLENKIKTNWIPIEQFIETIESAG